jgi:hypothetical protein
MEKIDFEKLLLKTAFCCLASDGNIDNREIEMIQSIFMNYDQYKDVNLKAKINSFIEIYNEKGRDFFTYYFDLLKEATFSLDEELAIIDIAIRTIQADELIEYSEIKFFKIIRHHLKATDNQILEKFPEIEMFLEEDIATESIYDKMKKQYFDTVELPQFEIIQLDNLEESDK